MDMLKLPNCGRLRNVIRILFDNELTELGQYVRTVGDAFKSKRDELGADFDKNTKNMTDAQRQCRRLHHAARVCCSRQA